MFYYDRFPFWCAYFQELGFDVVVSSPTDRKISMAGEELAIAQPCFPVKVAHGHVQDLLEKCVDYMLLPNTVNVEGAGRRPGIPPVPVEPDAAVRDSRRAPTGTRASQVPLAHVHFRLGHKHVEKELAEFARGLGIKPRVNAQAVMAGYAAQRPLPMPSASGQGGHGPPD